MKKKIFFASTIIGGCGLYALSKRGDRDLEKKRSIERNRTTKIVYREPKSEEYLPVFKDLSKLNLSFLQRFSAFHCFATNNYIEEIGALKKEYVDVEKMQLRPLFDQPDIFPVQLKPGTDTKSLKGINWSNLPKE